MQDNMIGTKVCISKMTIKELENSRKIIRESISNTQDKETLYNLRHSLSIINYHILLRKLLGHKYNQTN